MSQAEVINCETGEKTIEFVRVGPLLYCSKNPINADGNDFSTFTYFNEQLDTPAQVIFDVNGSQSVVPVTNSKAELEVTANVSTSIAVTCEGMVVRIEAV